MTSITALTHAAAAAAPPFNSNFYITAATAIPTLFVALAVQGNGYENLLKSSTALSNSRRFIPAVVVSSLLIAPATAILFFAVLGESLAVYALYQQQAESTTSQYVLVATITFVFATAVGPAVTFAKFFYNIANDRTSPPASAKNEPVK
jgi:hypothetical protein